MDNVPYNLAKRIIVFVSDSVVIEDRLKELKQYLQKCDYPDEIIDRGFHNARLQGPANSKTEDKNIVTFVHPNMANFDFSSIINKTKSLLKQSGSEDIKEVFNDVRIIEGIKQPNNILKSITRTRFRDNDTVNGLKPGIYAECSQSSGCELCKFGYMMNCDTFTTSSGKVWNIKSHINCNSRYVLY